jgi:Flp pilus assembly protein TadG
MANPVACKRTPRRQHGASAVEFALIAPLLFFLLFAAIEMGLIYWANLTMQHAVREGARYAVTGQSNLDTGATPQRHLAIIQNIRNNSMGLYNKLNTAISINNGTPSSDPATYAAGMFGNPGDILILRLDCTWRVMTPFLIPFFQDGQYRFSVAATMRNEAFPS